MAQPKIVLVVAHEGYQQVEYGTPKRILEDIGYKIITASDAAGAAIAKDGSTTQVDILIQDINPKEFDGIFFIGGPGALEHLDNETSYKMIRSAANSEIPLGAICISTRILAEAGILKGKNATGWDGDHKLADIYKNYTVHYVPEKVVVDGLIITASGPEAAEEFGQEIIAMIQDLKSSD